jgi:hypothetical protein
MKHVEDIDKLIRTLIQSETFHALIVESPPGWAKSTTVQRVLSEMGKEYVSLSSYSTPYFLFNHLRQNRNALTVIDDCAGLFNDQIGMSLLKAACWPSATNSNQREISWGSSIERDGSGSFAFDGKLILLTNHLPRGIEGGALTSRVLFLSITLSTEEIFAMLEHAGADTKFLPNKEVVKEVIEHLREAGDSIECGQVNLRTLRLGYELCLSHPEHWRDLLLRLMPKPSPSRVAESISRGPEATKEKVEKFCRLTGLSRRTYFNYVNIIDT